MERSRADGWIFWGVITSVVVSDVITKWMAVEWLSAYPLPVLGEVVRFSLVYNTGAAFGINVGAYSRPVFLVLTVGALFILARLYQATQPGDRLRTLALALVCGGAVGNLIDRIRWSRGVVDFLDVGWGTMRWPTFNIADMAVSTGAFMLAYVLWGEDRAAAAAATPAPVGASAPVPNETPDSR
jgi:signal peptidase II